MTYTKQVLAVMLFIVPLMAVVGLGLALLLNQPLRGRMVSSGLGRAGSVTGRA